MAEKEEYVVDKDLCIDCNACYTTYSEIFKQIVWEGATKADSFAPTEVGKYNPWDIVGICPVDAISKVGEMPPKPEKASAGTELAPLADQGPWEERYEIAKKNPDSRWDIMKRYGMAATLSQSASGSVMRMEFPDKTPNHILKFKMGLPDEMPDYRQEVQLSSDGKVLTITGFLEDPHIKSLCGKINSFPDRFKRTFAFTQPMKISRKVYRNKILTVELVPGTLQ